jgi:ABC-type transport system involved in multi-copper enzyme maturation permease subunit
VEFLTGLTRTWSVREWLKGQKFVYFDNAGAVRDFRVQLRGSRAILLWGAFLVVFSLFAFVNYSNMSNRSQFGGGATVSLSQAQWQLHNFYQTVTGILAGIVLLIAPAIGATAIVSERQKRFLDLLQSSPMSSKYYLVGKLISTYRSLGMLIVLSLPLVAVGASMGGVSYGDVFQTLLIISLDGLVFASLGLAISAGATKITSAILSSYLLAIYVIFGASSLAATGVTSALRGGARPEIPITTYLSPFTFYTARDGVTTVFGIAFPAWLAFCGFAIVLVIVTLLGAGSALSEKHVPETTKLRMLVLLLIGYAGYQAASMTARYISASMTLGVMAIPIVMVTPSLSCFVGDGLAKFIYDGPPRIKTALRAAPSGSLAYVVLLVCAYFGGAFLGSSSSITTGRAAIVGGYFVFAMGCNLFMWAVCRCISQFAPTLSGARGSSFIAVAIPFAICSVIANTLNGDDTSGRYNWLSPLHPLVIAEPARAFGWGVVLFALALGVFAFKRPAFFQTLREREILAS